MSSPSPGNCPLCLYSFSYVPGHLHLPSPTWVFLTRTVRTRHSPLLTGGGEEAARPLLDHCSRPSFGLSGLHRLSCGYKFIAKYSWVSIKPAVPYRLYLGVDVERLCVIL